MKNLNKKQIFLLGIVLGITFSILSIVIITLTID